MLLLEPNTMSTTEHVGWVLRHYLRDASGVAAVAGEQRLVEPAVRYGRVEVPLWLRLDGNSGVIRASYSLDGSNWTAIGTGQALAGSLRGGLLLNSGLGAITTEILFDHVIVAGARSSNGTQVVVLNRLHPYRQSRKELAMNRREFTRSAALAPLGLALSSSLLAQQAPPAAQPQPAGASAPPARVPKTAAAYNRHPPIHELDPFAEPISFYPQPVQIANPALRVGGSCA